MSNVWDADSTTLQHFLVPGFPQKCVPILKLLDEVGGFERSRCLDVIHDRGIVEGRLVQVLVCKV